MQFLLCYFLPFLVSAMPLFAQVLLDTISTLAKRMQFKVDNVADEFLRFTLAD